MAKVEVDELIKERFELPAFQKIVRLARAARTVVNNDNYEKIFNSLSEEQKKLIDIIVGLRKSDESDNEILGSPPFYVARKHKQLVDLN